MIYFLAEKPGECSEYYPDHLMVKHLKGYFGLLVEVYSENRIKMIPTCGKCLRNVHYNKFDFQWISNNVSNYVWTYLLLKSLLDEYAFRFRKAFFMANYFSQLISIPNNWETGDLQFHNENLPSYFKDEDIVEGFRNYLVKSSILDLSKWTNREKPYWIGDQK